MREGVETLRSYSSPKESFRSSNIGGSIREKRQKAYTRSEFVDRIRGFVPLYFVDFPFEYIVWPYHTNAFCFDMGLAAMILAFSLISYFLWRIGVVVPMIFHSFIIYRECPVLFSLFCLLMWTFALFKKIFFRHKSMMDMNPLFIKDYQMREDSDHSYLHSYIITAFFVLVSVVAKMYPQWSLYSGCSVFIMVMHMVRIVPGVGTHSTSGVFGFLVLVIFAIYCAPGAMTDIAEFFKRVLSSPTVPIEVRPVFDVPIIPARSTIADLGRDFFRLPRVGVSYDYASDIIRYMLGGVSCWWIVFDDVMGPGLETTAIIQAGGKREIKTEYIGSVRSSPMLLFSFMYLCYLAYMGDYISILLLMLTGFVVNIFWQLYSKPKWYERGAMATAVNLRGDAPVTRSDIESFRLYITAGCIILSGLFLAGRFGGYGGWLIAIAFSSIFYNERCGTFLLGISTANYLLIAMALTHSRPLTKSFRMATMPGNEDPII